MSNISYENEKKLTRCIRQVWFANDSSRKHCNFKMVHEIIEAVMIHGCLDIRTAATLKCCDRNADDLFSETIMNMMVLPYTTGDDFPVVWGANKLGEPIHDIASLKALKKRFVGGTDVNMMKKIIQHDEEVFFNTDTQGRLIDLCFNFEKYEDHAKMSDAFLLLFSQLLNKWSGWTDVRSPRDLVIAFNFIVNVFTRAIYWGIDNFRTVLDDESRFSAFTNSNFLKEFHKLKELYYGNIIKNVSDVSVRGEVRKSAQHAIKLIAAWKWSILSETPLYIGPRGGIFSVDPDGKKRYY